MAACSFSDVPEAARILRAGGLALYPTETFYAIGCRADNSKGVKAIYRLKARPESSPLPLLAASVRQVAQVASLPEEDLYGRLWPAPLALLLQARVCLPLPLLNPAGEVAIRVSASTMARQLARDSDFPLTCSSANFSGQPPAATFTRLDPAFLDALTRLEMPVAFLYSDCPPRYSRPSTIARIGPDCQITIIRPGAVDSGQIRLPDMS